MHGIETINRINEMASKSYQECQDEAKYQTAEAELRAEANPRALSLDEELRKAQAEMARVREDNIDRLLNMPLDKLLSLVHGNKAGSTPMEVALARKLSLYVR